MKHIILFIACAISFCASAEDGSNYWYSITFEGSTHELKVYENNGSKEFWREYSTASGQYGDILSKDITNNKWSFYYKNYYLQMSEQVTDSGFPTNLHFYGRNSSTGYAYKDFYLDRKTYAPPAPPAPQFTNTTSAVEVKGWKRHYIYGKADGMIHDPSGKVSPWVQAASIASTTRELSQIADAARVAASNNLERMYAVTNQVSTFTKKIFVQAQIYPDLTKLTNCWGRVVKEWTDGTNDHCWVYFSRELKTAPVMKREYKAQTFTNVVEGVWAVPSFTNQSVMVDGYAGCKELIYHRPDAFVMKNCFTQPYLKWGTQEAGFNFGQRVFTIDDALPFTGSWTNSLGKIWKFNNGTLVGEPTDVQ